MTRDVMPPSDLDAERALLGSILIDGRRFDDVDGIVRPDDFYAARHQRVYEAMASLATKRMAIDYQSVVSMLSDSGHLDEAGGEDRIVELASATPTPFHAETYAALIADCSILRRVTHAASDAVRLAHQERPAHGDRTRAAIVLDQAQRAMFDIQPRNAGQHRRPIGEVIAAVRDRMDQRIRDREAGGSDLTGVPSGYQQLDAMTGGWQPGDLIVLAARTGDGKTAFAVNLLCRAAHKQIPGAFFSLEMPAEQIGIRMVSMVARIDGIRIRDGKLAHRLDTDEPGEVVRAMSTVAEWPVHIDDTPALSTIDLRRDARRMVRDYQIGIIFVDYLQLMTAGIRTERRVQEVTEITRALKALARELNIPVIACAQLNRAVEERTDGPRLSDLRESGSIEQDADMVLFLHRQADDAEASPRKIRLDIAKHRNGPLGRIWMRFHDAYGRFAEGSG